MCIRLPRDLGHIGVCVAWPIFLQFLELLLHESYTAGAGSISAARLQGLVQNLATEHAQEALVPGEKMRGRESSGVQKWRLCRYVRHGSAG